MKSTRNWEQDKEKGRSEKKKRTERKRREQDRKRQRKRRKTAHQGDNMTREKQSRK